MIIPISCFTCNKVIAHLWEEYLEKLKSKEKKKINDNKSVSFENEILEKLGIKRYCCKRMFLTNNNYLNTL